MKKKLTISISALILLIFGIYLFNYNKKDVITFSNTVDNDRIAIYLVNENGIATLSNSNVFPTEGYTFNSERSICENGTYIEWNDRDKSLSLVGDIKDSCKVYFDVYVPTFADTIIELASTNNHIYHHTSDTTAADYVANNAGDDSYRYSGPSSTVNDNYVCFGYDINNYTNECESGTFSASSDYAYRIIGVFKDVDGGSDDAYYVKLIKAAAYIGGGSTVAWNSSNSNTFSASPLFSTDLNGTGSGYLYTLNTNGWTSYLAQAIWNVGGCKAANCSDGTAKTAYTGEMVTSGSNSYGAYGTSVTNNTYKIGLMYVNDYAYATTSNYWTTALNTYNSAAAVQDWLYVPGLGDEWTTSRHSTSESYIYDVRADGHVDTIYANFSYVVRPVLYLASNVKATGTGTTTDPYVLSM